MKIIPYGRQSITKQDIDAVVKCLTSDYLTQGPHTQMFEEKFAAYVGSKYAVAVASGTAALHLSALALGVNKKSNIITTPITFAASSNCIRYCGGRVSFVDVDPESILIDINKVRALLEESPRGKYQGIIPVDFAGYPVDLEKLRALADEFGLWILEDACHSPGGYFVDSNGIKQHCGNGLYADLSVFSFHPVKHIACGEGGMITTNSRALYERLLLLRTHGITRSPDLMTENHGGWYYQMLDLGYNYRITDFQCALGISQLTRADMGLSRRRQIAKKYDEAFKDIPARPVLPTESFGHAYHLYIIRVNQRKRLFDVLRSRGVYAQVHYIPVHMMPYYQKLGHKRGSLPIAESYYESCISLPMFPTLTDEEQNYVIDIVLQNAN